TATVTAVTITITTVTAITAVVTAPRRRRRRSPAATTSTVTAVTITTTTVATVTASPRAATIATSTNERSTNEHRADKAKCFGPGGNGGSSEWESCCEHDGNFAESQLHDTSLCFFGGEPALELCFASLHVKQGASWDLQAAISRYLATW